MVSFLRSGALVLGAAVVILIALVALESLARFQLRQHLDSVAASTLGALVHEETPHRWFPSRAGDVIAARAFGTEESQFGATGFRMRSQGKPMDVGLVIAGTIDLERYPRLAVKLDSEQAGELSVLVRESLDGPVCASARTPFGLGPASLLVELDHLDWACEGNGLRAPRRAAMLRLRIELPRTASTILTAVAAHPSAPLGMDALENLELPILPSPREVHAFDRQLARIAQNSRAGTWPVLQVPFDGRVEQILVARDRVLRAIPDSVVVANGDFASVANAARHWRAPSRSAGGIWLPRILIGIYALLLLILRLKPPLDTRLRAGLELLGAVAVPVCLVVGGFIGDDIDPYYLGACAITLVFALSLLLGGAPAQPSARTLKRGWWIALASFALTLGIVLFATGGHLPGTLPGLPRVAHYVAWAAVQQFLICVIVAERIERLSGSDRWGLFGAALIFSLLHAPNAMLMQLTFVAGLIWVWNWQRHRALLANMVAHAACGLLLTTSLPKEWLHSAEVSARFFLIGGS